MRRHSSKLERSDETHAAARRPVDFVWLWHAAILAAAIGVPVLGLAMARLPEGRVALAGFEAYPLPTVCLSRRLGFECPTCGVTRSMIALMHGDLTTSIGLHRFGWLVLALIVLQIPYRTYRLTFPERRLPRIEAAGIVLLAATALIVVVNRLAELLGVV